uniref:Expressed conserved protein n=1 Tax=Echinococcus granulosus TaxID=6210 RepID=A0A068WY95_ECHGR|nr:hypothetical protein EgrG_002061800 [Echinococcus granulosus]
MGSWRHVENGGETNPPSTPEVTPHKHASLSPRFKRLVTIATALPLLALILVICTTHSPHWERVHFLFHRLIQRACSQQEKTTWRLAHVELEGVGVGGVRLFDNQTRWDICHLWKETPPPIMGVGIYNGSALNATVIEVLNVLGGAFQMCKGKQGECVCLLALSLPRGCAQQSSSLIIFNGCIYSVVTCKVSTSHVFYGLR